jgi:hypothetical protein
MTHPDLQTRAVQGLLSRGQEFRAFLLNAGSSDCGSYQYSNSIAYSWELVKLFSDTPSIAAEARTMEDVARYMYSHAEHRFYCQVELWCSLNSVLNALARRFSPEEIFGTVEKSLAAAVTTLEKCDKTLSHNHVDFEYARFLVLHAARMLHEASVTLEASKTSTAADEQLRGKLDSAREPLTRAIVALEKNTSNAATAARDGTNAALALFKATAA